MNQRADFVRTVILGNSGSGKSFLARRMSGELSVPAIDLDEIHWEPGGYAIAREKDQAVAMVRQHRHGSGWIIEGVYGWLAEEALPNATALIWLDIDNHECLANLRQRGVRGGGDEASFASLLVWAGEYRVRETASSFVGHRRLFSEFTGRQLRLRSRPEMADFTAALSPPTHR